MHRVIVGEWLIAPNGYVKKKQENKDMSKMKDNLWVIITGLVVGLIAVGLTVAGNPGNMGFCIACFVRDIAGGVKLHTAAVVQYVRPEIIGIVLGAMVMALASGEFKAQGGSAPVSRFVLGFFVMVGALMFLGCPLRMVLRLGGGDMNALFGIVGFACGIWVGSIFLNKGFSLKRSFQMPTIEGYALPAINVVLLIGLLAFPSLLAFSEEGPGSQRAAIGIALAAGLAVGALAQKSRLCFAGGIRDAIMFKDFHLLSGFVAVIAAALVGNLIVGKFNLGFAGQPVAYSTLVNGDFIWAFLGMFLVGLASVFLGGCPLRQLVLSAAGNSDSTVAVLGMTIGAAFCHNFGLASSANGTTLNGKVAVVLGIAVTAVIGVMNCKKGEK